MDLCSGQGKEAAYMGEPSPTRTQLTTVTMRYRPVFQGSCQARNFCRQPNTLSSLRQGYRILSVRTILGSTVTCLAGGFGTGVTFSVKTAWTFGGLFCGCCSRSLRSTQICCSTGLTVVVACWGGVASTLRGRQRLGRVLAVG